MLLLRTGSTRLVLSSLFLSTLAISPRRCSVAFVSQQQSLTSSLKNARRCISLLTAGSSSGSSLRQESQQERRLYIMHGRKRKFSNLGGGYSHCLFSKVKNGDDGSDKNDSVSSSSSSPYYGAGMNQHDMMESDMLLAVDCHDNLIPDVSLTKRMAHTFNNRQPRGVAHRAFSVFLFNGENKLLLTKRASSKITFPNVWTNTCCSHPLYGMTPNEVDDCANDWPAYPGITHAARRKLQHELGIHPDDLPMEQFHFLTKFHYWATDTITYGKQSPPWGEHEIDYVLFIRCDGEDNNINGPELNPNPEEVSDWKYVTPSELRFMFQQESDDTANNNNNNDDDGSQKHLWSPWFRGIMERGGFTWWENLEESLRGQTSIYCNRDITYFDPPKEHMADFNLPNHGKDVGVWATKDAILEVAGTSGSKS